MPSTADEHPPPLALNVERILARDVVVVEQHEEWRALIRVTLGAAGFTVTGETTTGTEARPGWSSERNCRG